MPELDFIHSGWMTKRIDKVIHQRARNFCHVGVIERARGFATFFPCERVMDSRIRENDGGKCGGRTNYYRHSRERGNPD